MVPPGPKPRPPLAVVREGNPGKRPVREGVKAPLAAEMAPPDWDALLPGSAETAARAAGEWARVVPLLAVTAGLADVDRVIVQDYCLCVARLEECERRISLDGLVVMGQRGECRHPLTSVAAQYRTQLKTYIGELGLSPSARGRIEPPGVGDGDEGNPFGI